MKEKDSRGEERRGKERRGDARESWPIGAAPAKIIASGDASDVVRSIVDAPLIISSTSHLAESKHEYTGHKS